MMSGHGGNPIFFNKNIKIGRPEHSLIFLRKYINNRRLARVICYTHSKIRINSLRSPWRHISHFQNLKKQPPGGVL